MIRRTIPALLLIACLAHTVSAADDSVNFSRDILPLLSDKCFKCHGPDEANRQAGLRLDKQAAAIAKLESGHSAVVPGKSDQSELLQRILRTTPI